MICKKAKEKLKVKTKEWEIRQEESNCFDDGVCPKCGSENVKKRKSGGRCKDCKHERYLYD